MSWDTMMPILLRSTIGDTDSTPKYNDDTLLPIIATAAYSLLTRLEFSRAYEIDVENLSITPDPTDIAPQDTAFVNLVNQKAAVMLLYAEVRRYGQQAISIRDGTSAIDLKRDLKALQTLADRYDQELEKIVANYQRGFYGFGGRVVVSPYKTLLSNIERHFYPRVCRW